MNSQKTVQSIEDIRSSENYQAAVKLSEETKMFNALNGALHDDVKKEFALKNPTDYLKQHGIELPENLKVVFSKNPRDLKPIPGDEVAIRLFNCITFLVPDAKGLPHEETVCFGFEVISHSGSPLGR